MNTTFVREVSLRYKGRKKLAASFLSGPEASADFIRRVLPDNVKEHFIALFLNGAHDVVGYSVVFTGTANSCPVSVREIMQPALMMGSIAFVVAHNHPSNNSAPSSEDKVVTTRLKEAGDLVGIKLLDHLIVTDDSYYSFSENSAL